MRITAILAGTLTGALGGALLAAPTSGAAAPAADEARVAARQIVYREWDGAAQWRKGGMQGLRVLDSALRISDPAGSRTFNSRQYETGRWTSKWVFPGFSLTEVIPSWSARTPGSTWIEVQLRGKDAAGKRSSWDVLGRWTANDRALARHTVDGQIDDLAKVNVDTWRADKGLKAYQVRLMLMRPAGTEATPVVDTVGAVASRLPAGAVPTSRPGVAKGIRLPVPRYSQMTHRGHYPRWGSGGEAWCSPTSTSMVLGYYGALPSARAYGWVADDHVDPWVDHAARQTYDDNYDGTGNWPFNTAYAGPLAGKAFVTRLRSLREAEHFIKARIPLVASISFSAGELDGAPISSSNGHLLVIAGFTRSGDVIVNDPAARAREAVRRVYDRGQFENVWLPTSGGLVYVIRDARHPLPDTAHTNW